MNRSKPDTFVALLRGVNVGTAKRVPMVELRALLGRLGYSGVSTLLNSGNAVFRATGGAPAKLALDIAGALAKELKVEVPVVVKSAVDFAAIIRGNLLAANAPDPSRLLVIFAPAEEDLARQLAAIASLVTPPEQFLLGKHAAYLHCTAGILESPAGKAILGPAGEAVTTRNWATVLKLQALLDKS